MTDPQIKVIQEKHGAEPATDIYPMTSVEAVEGLETLLSTMEEQITALGSNKEDKSNKVSAFQSTPDNDHYPSEKLVKDNLNLKENLSNKVSAWSGSPDNNHYPTEKLVNDTFVKKDGTGASTPAILKRISPIQRVWMGHAFSGTITLDRDVTPYTWIGFTLLRHNDANWRYVNLWVPVRVLFDYGTDIYLNGSSANDQIFMEVRASGNNQIVLLKYEDLYLKQVLVI